MKNISSQLIDFFLSTASFQMADLITISLINGQNIYAVYGTNIDITYNSITYYASQYGAWERGEITSESSFRPDSQKMKLTVLAEGTVLYPGTSTPLMATLNAGLFDGATVSITTVYWPMQTLPTVANIVGSLVNWAGQIGNMTQTGGSKVEFECYDMLFLLNRTTPPNLIQTQCRHTLFNPNCTLNQNNFKANTTLKNTSTTLEFDLNISNWIANHTYGANSMVIDSNGNIQWTLVGGTSASSHPTWATTPPGATTVDNSSILWVLGEPDYFTLGKVLVTSGQNTGLEFTIKNQFVSGGTQALTLMTPAPFPIAGGESVSIFAGCNKTIAQCGSVKFNNLIHFGGMPFVPDPGVAAG